MYKNKTFAMSLASVFGGFGIHRFYLYGKKDWWGWIHFGTAPISLLAITIGGNRPAMFLGLLFILSVLIGFLEALVIGITPDDKWNRQHNHHANKQTVSGWPLALLLVLTLGVSAIAFIATLARTFDLLYTGGAYG